MSKERLEETDFEEIWKPVKSVIEYYRMDYGEAVTIGGQFGVLKREIKLLHQQNKRYREAIENIEKGYKRILSEQSTRLLTEQYTRVVNLKFIHDEIKALEGEW